jgi:pimeloyl-ACP methyl ester carboxylesterase
MATRTYEEFHAEFMEQYRAEQFGKALELLTLEGEEHPEQAPTVLYLRACMAARVGENDLALKMIEEADKRGFWYGEQIMRQTPSWQHLQGDPGFEQLVETFKAREADVRDEPRLFTLEPEGGCTENRRCPLLLALHGNNDNAQRALNGWRPVVADGWLLASLQSSQVAMTGAYVWDDQERALREVAEHFEAIKERYAVDEGRVIVAGFSMGGETALRIALQQTVPAKAFILLGPGGPMIIETPEEWPPLIEGARERGLRGFVFMGDLEAEHEPIRALVRLLNEQGIPCGLEILPGLAHEYPPDFSAGLRRALAFVEQE